MATSTVEDYVKQVFLIQQELNGETAPMGRLSEALGITPGTTTTMVKSLADAGMVEYEPRIGVRLTSDGQSLALGFFGELADLPVHLVAMGRRRIDREADRRAAEP